MYLNLTILTVKWWCVIVTGGEGWCVIDPLASRHFISADI